MNILVIEDDVLVTRVNVGLMKRLVSEGGRVDNAYDGATAKALVERNEYDIILMDFGLPDCHGLDLTRYFRSQGINALIVGVSGNLAQARPQERVDAGLDWGYQKPLRAAQVAEIVQRYHEKFSAKH